MNTVVRKLILSGAVLAAIAVGGPVAAHHDHYIVTPGACVADVARGQTAKLEGEGGHHRFHDNVHLGTPGTEAFTNQNNPVMVYKNGTGPGCQG